MVLIGKICEITQKNPNKNQVWVVQRKTACYWKVMKLFCDRAEELKGHPANSLTSNSVKEQKISVVVVLQLQNETWKNMKYYPRGKQRNKTMHKASILFHLFYQYLKKRVSSFQCSGGVIKRPFKFFFLHFNRKISLKYCHWLKS